LQILDIPTHTLTHTFKLKVQMVIFDMMKTASEKGNEYAFATKLGLFFGNIDKKTG
jgi:hypothetical protein